MRRGLAAAAVLLLCAAANGQNLFTNGDFETGDWSGWTVKPTTNGQTLIQTVEMYDIDGPGLLKDSLAGHLCVGKVSGGGSAAGVHMTQSLNLIAGEPYKLEADVSSFFDTNVYFSNLDGGQYELVVGQTVIDRWACGEIPKMEKKYHHLSGEFTPTADGAYDVGLKIVRDWLPPSDLGQFVDNVVCVPEPATAALLLGLLLLRRR